MFGIPYDANFRVAAVYQTSKLASSGYRPPREHIIEFVWSEDVTLAGKRFGSLSGTTMPMLCGGTIVFDITGNFLHLAQTLPSDRRRGQLRDYIAYLVAEGSLGIVDGLKGIGAPGAGSMRFTASVDDGRLAIRRNAALRHERPEGHPNRRGNRHG